MTDHQRSIAIVAAALLAAACGGSATDGVQQATGTPPVSRCQCNTIEFWATPEAPITDADAAYLSTFPLVTASGGLLGTVAPNGVRAFLANVNPNVLANALSAQWAVFALNARHLAFCSGAEAAYLAPQYASGGGSVATFSDIEKAVRAALDPASTWTTQEKEALKTFLEGPNNRGYVCVCGFTGATGATGGGGATGATP